VGDLHHDASRRSLSGNFVSNWMLLAALTVVTVPWMIGIVWVIDVAAHRVGSPGCRQATSSAHPHPSKTVDQERRN
jgi:hypothetical protein